VICCIKNFLLNELNIPSENIFWFWNSKSMEIIRIKAIFFFNINFTNDQNFQVKDPANSMFLATLSLLRKTSSSYFAFAMNIISFNCYSKITSFKSQCFQNSSSLSLIIIPDSVNSIGESCFYKCDSLISITIPNSVNLLENHVFLDVHHYPS
jgi:hypothetical protein